MPSDSRRLGRGGKLLAGRQRQENACFYGEFALGIFLPFEWEADRQWGIFFFCDWLRRPFWAEIRPGGP